MAHYSYSAQMLDDYGRFVHVPGSRIPVAPYTVYFSRDELRFVDSCARLHLPPAKFYEAITAQKFVVPKEYRIL
jgi:hypothetical protein